MHKVTTYIISGIEIGVIDGSITITDLGDKYHPIYINEEDVDAFLGVIDMIKEELK